MKRHAQPLSCKEWEQAAAETYRLRQQRLDDDGLEVRLYGRSRGLGERTGPLSSAPYGTDGGVQVEPGRSSARCLEEMLQRTGAPYLLMKSRDPLIARCHQQVQVDPAYATFVLDLEGGAERVWNDRMAGKVRQQVRKGQRSAPSVRVGHCELLDDFYTVISHCWRDLGTPMHSRQLFVRLLQAFGPDRSAIMMLDLQGRPVSTALLLIVGDTLHHPFTGTLKTCQSLAVNNVLYWEIIQWACQRELRWFDMGRSPRDGGGARYKRPWGVREVPLYYTYLLRDGVAMPRLDGRLTRAAVSAWKWVPLWMANRAGPLLIRNVL